jgi:glycosyltransferase involved in cell wall biosynthesis
MDNIIKPAVSIVMPLYNKETDVMRTINSVLSQSITDFELLVVNDGSTDKGPDMVRAISDPRIRIVDQENQGVSVARNRGIAEANSALIAFLDADDEWEADYLETILRLRNKFPDCDVYATAYYFAREDGQRRNAILRGIKSCEDEFRLDNYFEVAVQSEPPLWTSAVAVSKKAIDSVGGFPVGVTAGEDLLTWARLALRFSIAYSVSAHAIFYSPVFVSDRPSRLPQQPDIVGDGLAMLQSGESGSLSEGLANYIALWHRMRAVVYIQVGKMADARNELKMAVSYSDNNKRLLFLELISHMPYKLAVLIFTMIKRFQEIVR